ncbi:MAG TPA: helix-turn-helix transcriptional regulator [Alphaproteobacteria bacterium]|jgi:transcriptional regulator with XRE-family HTH domain
MVTIEQIRAARALLGWSQGDLADRAGLSQTGIARIESGSHRPTMATLDKIAAAFEKAHIEFLGATGLRKRQGEVRTLEGRQGLRNFMDDVYETARDQGGDIRLFNGVPAALIKWLGQEWYDAHSQRMEAIRDKFTFRVIVRHGEGQLIGSRFASYRTFPEDLFHEQTFYAYGDRLAFLSFGENDVRVLVLHQAEFSDSFRILFDIAWNSVAQPLGEGRKA